MEYKSDLNATNIHCEKLCTHKLAIWNNNKCNEIDLLNLPDVSALQTAIADITSKITNNTTDITSITDFVHQQIFPEIEINEGSITANNALIMNINQQVNNHDGRISLIERFYNDKNNIYKELTYNGQINLRITFANYTQGTMKIDSGALKIINLNNLNIYTTDSVIDGTASQNLTEFQTECDISINTINGTPTTDLIVNNSNKIQINLNYFNTINVKGIKNIEFS